MAESNPIEVQGILRAMPPETETVFDLVESLAGKGKRLEIIQRKVNPEIPNEPALARPLARCHEFHDIDTFARYLGDDSLVLADVDSQRIVAVLDEQDETDREQVSFIAKIHPNFRPWHELLNKRVPILQFAIHCMQHRRTVIEPEGMELAHTMSQVKASKVITRRSGVGKSSINGVMVELQVAGEKKEAAVELPDSITILAPMFIGLGPVELEIDLLVTEHDEEIVVYCTSAMFEEARVAAFEQFMLHLRSVFSGLCGHGKVAHRDWRVVK